MTVLYELGRVGDPVAVCELADVLCNGRFTATGAARRIRAWRLDKPILPQARTGELSEVIYRTIKQYSASHEGVTRERLLTACEEAIDAWDL